MDIKVGILIPDRGDRPELLANCLRMMEAQTLKPHIIELVNDRPSDDKCDITKRYRLGYERLRGKGLDVTAFIENDDWYSPLYLHTMVNAWIENGKPDLFGTNCTIYFHIKLQRYLVMDHDDRSSAMNTFIKPDMTFPWCPDNEPFTDMHLWLGLKNKITNKYLYGSSKVISMGMKHGIGKCGGGTHVSRLTRYKYDGKELLKETLDPSSYEFYNKFYDPDFLSNIPPLHNYVKQQ